MLRRLAITKSKGFQTVVYGPFQIINIIYNNAILKDLNSNRISKQNFTNIYPYKIDKNMRLPAHWDKDILNPPNANTTSSPEDLRNPQCQQYVSTESCKYDVIRRRRSI